MAHGLLVAALRAERLANSGRFLPAEPAYSERVHISRTRSEPQYKRVCGSTSKRNARNVRTSQQSFPVIKPQL